MTAGIYFRHRLLPLFNLLEPQESDLLALILLLKFDSKTAMKCSDLTLLEWHFCCHEIFSFLKLSSALVWVQVWWLRHAVSSSFNTDPLFSASPLLVFIQKYEKLYRCNIRTEWKLSWVTKSHALFVHSCILWAEVINTLPSESKICGSAGLEHGFYEQNICDGKTAMCLFVAWKTSAVDVTLENSFWCAFLYSQTEIWICFCKE